eukprot:6461449-Amphidinium_carterae.2
MSAADCYFVPPVLWYIFNDLGRSIEPYTRERRSIAKLPTVSGTATERGEEECVVGGHVCENTHVAALLQSSALTSQVQVPDKINVQVAQPVIVPSIQAFSTDTKKVSVPKNGSLIGDWSLPQLHHLTQLLRTSASLQ